MQIGLPLGVSRQSGGGSGGGGGGGGLGLKFDIATATAGVVFSDDDTTVTNPTANIRSAKATAGITPNAGNNWYWEFTVRSTTQQMYVGLGLPGFVCDGVNRIGIVANSVAYNTGTGQVIAGGAARTTVAASTAAGDVIGFKLEVFNPGSLLTILKNNVVILSQFDTSAWITDNSVAWTPIWSGLTVANSSTTISNNIYSYAGYTPIGTAATTIAASASVTPVADGAYDVYTFNASGTFTTTTTGAVRALVIAGGGGGGGTGGGGAGGYQEKGVVTTPQTYAITVGAGGTAAALGANSSIGSALVSTGGGSGDAPNKNGGSGGGGSPSQGFDNAVAGGTGIAGQGFAGGYGFYDIASGPAYTGGGGGGAGAVGGQGGVPWVGGDGGTGKSSDITGTATTRGGGGGGQGSAARGFGGAGGGGAGGPSPTNGTANTGGGAGGASMTGGSGVVIIRVRARA